MSKCKSCGAPVNLAPDGDPKYDPPRRNIPAMLAEARAKGIREAVQIKPLTWYDIPEGQDCRIGRCGQTAYSVRFKMGHWGYSRSGYAGHIVSGKGTPYFTTEKEAMQGADTDHRERILEALLDQPAETEGVTVQEDGFFSLVRDGMTEGDKAMRKFPQPNYVISKFAEESGEVVKAAIHCAEGRETPENVLGEMRQVIAMMYRLWVEGDQVHALRALAGDRHD